MIFEKTSIKTNSSNNSRRVSLADFVSAQIEMKRSILSISKSRYSTRYDKSSKFKSSFNLNNSLYEKENASKSVSRNFSDTVLNIPGEITLSVRKLIEIDE